MERIYLHYVQTPLATFVAGVFDGKCCLFEFADRRSLQHTLEKKEKALGAQCVQEFHPLHNHIEKEIGEYFAGKRKSFTIPLHLDGIPFQMKVWQELLRIPYGETISYKELGERVGNPKAMRAVGAANGANSIAIIVPCHRVIRHNGHLQGYRGGIHRKKRLLELESSKQGQKRLEAFLH